MGNLRFSDVLTGKGENKKTTIGMVLAAVGTGDAGYSLEGKLIGPPIDPDGPPPGMRCLLTLD